MYEYNENFKQGSRCAVNGCENYQKQRGETKSFFRMPKNIIILEKWISACSRPELNKLLKSKTPEYFYKTHVVCSDHFEAQCFRNKDLFSQGLFPGSVPTLKLGGKTITSKRKSQEKFLDDPRTKETKPQPIDKIDAIKCDECEAIDPLALALTSDSQSNNEESSDVIRTLKIENMKLKSALTKYQNAFRCKSKSLYNYKKRNELLREKIRVLKKQVKKQG